MNLEPYLKFAGVEIANSNRTLTYLRRGLAPPMFSVGLKETLLPGDPFQPGNLAVYCATTSEAAYQSPALDPAPWYIGTPASGEFLGLYAHDIKLLPIIARPITGKTTDGGVLGHLHLKYRVLQISAYMFAASPRGMKYGEQWLEQILKGTITGCPQDTLVLLPVCGDSLRNLLETGTVDGPETEPVEQVPECYMQKITWQMASAYPEFVTDLIPVQPPTPITNAAPICGDVVGDASGVRTAGVVTIYAGTGGPATDLHIVGEPGSGYSDTYTDTYDDFNGYYIDYTVATMPEGSTLVIDGALETVTLYNAGGAVIGGMEVLTIRGAFNWPVVWGGSTMRLCVNSPSGTLNADTAVTVESRVMA